MNESTIEELLNGTCEQVAVDAYDIAEQLRNLEADPDANPDEIAAHKKAALGLLSGARITVLDVDDANLEDLAQYLDTIEIPTLVLEGQEAAYGEMEWDALGYNLSVPAHYAGMVDEDGEPDFEDIGPNMLFDHRKVDYGATTLYIR